MNAATTAVGSRRPEPENDNDLAQPAAPPLSRWGRPRGWLGWWSERYARVIARSLPSPRPYDAASLADQLAAAAPLPFAEALDAVASVAEPRDREGQLLPWHFAQSATLDLFGGWGVIFGALTVGLVILNFVVAHSVGQIPTRKEPVIPQTGTTNITQPPASIQEQPSNPAGLNASPGSNAELPSTRPSNDQPNLKPQTPDENLKSQTAAPIQQTPRQPPPTFRPGPEDKKPRNKVPVFRN